MIVNGLNEYVSEMSEETKDIRNDEIGDSAPRPAAKARPKQTSMPIPSFPRVTTISHAKMDRCRTRRVRPKLFWSFEEDGQIASTWSFCTSRRRRSSWIKNFGADVGLKIRVFSALINSNMAELFAKVRWSQKKISVVSGYLLCWDHFIPSNNSRPFWCKTNWFNIPGQRVVTERLRRLHLPRRTFPRHAYHHPIRIDSGWERYMKGIQKVFFTAVNPMSITSTPAEGLRLDEAQNCSLPTKL